MTMTFKMLAASVVLAASAVAAQAAPGAPVGAMKDVAPAAESAVQDVRVVRQCYWRHGYRVCRLVKVAPHYGYRRVYRPHRHAW
jgi:hypothetical protein